MNILTKMALGLMGQMKPKPVLEGAATALTLPAPTQEGGVPLMEALHRRHSARAFQDQALPEQLLSDLLWAAYGINRPELGGRTAPSALNAQEVDVYVALATGTYRYEAQPHALSLVTASDVRRVTGYQDFVDKAPLDLIFVANHSRMSMVPAAQRHVFAAVAAGAIAQNVYLFAASSGLATVIRAWIDRSALSKALDLSADHEVLLSQTVGYPEDGAAH